MNTSSPRPALAGPLLFVSLRGMLTAASLVSASTLTWIVSRTQPDMTVRVAIQLIAGMLALTLAYSGAWVAKRFGGTWLAASLALLLLPFPLLMSAAAEKASIAAGWLLLYGVGLALIEAFSFPAQEALQNGLFHRASPDPALKSTGVKVKNSVQFIVRIVLWATLAAGAFELQGIAAARWTFRVEALLLAAFVVFLLAVFGALRTEPPPPKAVRPGDKHPADLTLLFILEFCLNGFFIGALMLPKILPNKELAAMNWVLALGALGSLAGTCVARPTARCLWLAIGLDVLFAAATFQARQMAFIAAGWFAMSFCYGMFDTIFARAVQAGMSANSADRASTRRFLMNGLRPFTMYVLIKAQVYFGLGDREIVNWSLLLTVLLLAAIVIRRKRRIEAALLLAQG